jgi:hypothetical protein
LYTLKVHKRLKITLCCEEKPPGRYEGGGKSINPDTLTVMNYSGTSLQISILSTRPENSSRSFLEPEFKSEKFLPICVIFEIGKILKYERINIYI